MTMLHIVTGTLVHAILQETTKHTHTQRNISYFKR